MTASRKLCYAAVAFLIFVSISFALVTYVGERSGLLTVSVLNIGQGDAIFIEAPSGVQFIIDGGPGDALLSELGAVMPFYDRTLDGIMVTNPDLDHYSGFLSALSRYKVGLVVEAGTQSNTPTYTALESMINEQGIPKKVAKRGMKIVLDPLNEVYIEILFPDRDVSRLSTNDGSIVAKLVYKNTSMMLQGDSPQKIESYLISLDRSSLDADILKLGHHGSRTSTAPEYVRAVSPKYAVASLGKDNSYGHPHVETINTLVDLHVPLLRTDTMGRITFVSDGKNFIKN